MKRRWLVPLAGALPMLVSVVYKVLLHPRPFWAVFYDPETIYMYDAARIVSGHPPLNADNPATPVQLMTAAIELFTGTSPFAIDAIRYSGYAIALVTTLAATWLLSATRFRDADPWLAVAGLWTYWLAPRALGYDAIWSPEIFYFAAGALVLAALTRPDRPWLAGAATGLCIAVKFTFLAWAPALVLAVLIGNARRSRAAVIATVAALGAFFVCTVVALPRYPKMFGWLWTLATHSGQYGKGAHEPPKIGHALAEYFSLAVHAKAALLWVAVVIVLWFVARRRNATLTTFAVVSAILTLLMALRSPDYHYLLPIGLSLTALLASARDISPRVAMIACALCAVLAGKTVLEDLHSHDQLIADSARIHAQLAAAVERSGLRDPIVIYGWRVPQPSFALRTCSGATPAFLDAVSARYPYEGHFDNDLRRIYLPSGATRWDLLVVDPQFVNEVPGGVGPVIASVPPFIVVKHP